MHLVQYGNSIELTLVKPVKAARGLIKGMVATFECEDTLAAPPVNIVDPPSLLK